MCNVSNEALHVFLLYNGQKITWEQGYLVTVLVILRTQNQSLKVTVLSDSVECMLRDTD